MNLSLNGNQKCVEMDESKSCLTNDQNPTLLLQKDTFKANGCESELPEWS